MVAFLLPPLEAVHSSFFVNPCVNAPKGSLFFAESFMSKVPLQAPATCSFSWLRRRAGITVARRGLRCTLLSSPTLISGWGSGGGLTGQPPPRPFSWRDFKRGRRSFSGKRTVPLLLVPSVGYAARRGRRAVVLGFPLRVTQYRNWSEPFPWLPLEGKLDAQRTDEV